MRSAAAFASIAVVAVLASDPEAARAAETYDAVDLELIRVAGVIEIESGGVDRVAVDYDPGEGLVDAPQFRVRGDRLEVTQLERRTRISCRSRNDGLRMAIGRGDYHPIEDYGRFVIRVPAGARVDVHGGGVTGEIGDVGALDLGLSSCGDVTAGDVAGEADIAVNGSGDVRVGDVGGSLDAAINGSGDITVGAVAGSLDAAINGSGDIEVASVNGSIDAAIRGSGDIWIKGGEADTLDAAIMGSGEVRFDGVAGSVDLAAFGSGDIYVSEVTGRIETAAMGSGRVHVGRD